MYSKQRRKNYCNCGVQQVLYF